MRLTAAILAASLSFVLGVILGVQREAAIEWVNRRWP